MPLMENSTTRTRLCPNCANSIDEDAANCPYCKTDVGGHFVPQWLKRDDDAPDAPVRPDRARSFSVPAKLAWIGATVVAALIGLFAGVYMQHGRELQSAQAHLKEIQAKDQIIQSQETQLAQTRQQLTDSSKQLAESKTKLEQSQKELSSAQQRVASTDREVERLKASRSVAARKSPARVASAAALPPVRRALVGVYQTTRETPVRENPSSGSRVLSQIKRGTRINVVSSTGDWLEVRSRRGNPPGYVRVEDARPIGGAG